MNPYSPTVSSIQSNLLPSWQRRLVTRSFALATAMVIPAISYGASQTWVAAPVDATWANGLNWSGGAAPGAISTSFSNATPDIATFNTALAGGTIGGVTAPIVIDLDRNIRGLTFDTAAVGAYVIGSSGGNRLNLTHSGTIQLTANVTSAITIDAPLSIKLPSSTNGTYTYRNDATSTAATLTFSGTLASLSADTRPVTLTLDGLNTGDNLISGIYTNTGATNAGAFAFVKNGTGKWILSAANNLTAETDVGVTTGGTVNNGTLVVQNASVFGAAGTQAVVNGGVLQIDNVTLNQNNINLNTTGEIRMNGSGTANGLIVGAAANGTISTTSASDAFTIGAAANRITGGAGATTRVSGPGTVLIPFSNNYTGGWSFNGSGLTQLGVTGSLGAITSTVAFGAGSTATLRLNGNNTTIGGLSTNATPGAPVVDNGAGTSNTLTVNPATANTFAGVLQDGGGGGTLALVKGGAGTLALAGNNTYTGGTTINAGTLLASNLAGSATGDGFVQANTSSTLGGAGFITGPVTVSSNATLSPGVGGVGTLTLGSLTLDAGALLNYEIASLASFDQTVVTGALSLGTGITMNVNSATTIGAYDIFTSTGLSGDTTGWAVTNGVAGYGYAFTTLGNNVRLTISLSGLVTTWAAIGGGTWGDNANWTNTAPNAAGSTAKFLGSIVAPSVVTLDGSKTVGSITFDNANKYTIAEGTGGSLLINNNGSPAQVDVVTGSHEISAPVTLADNFQVASATGTLLAISGAIAESGGAKSLTKAGNGELILSAPNSFTGGVNLNGGTLEFASLNSLGSAGDIAFNGGALRYGAGNTADISARVVTFGPGGATIHTNGNNVTFAGAVGNAGLGGLTKAGAGTLTLAVANNYQGPTVITGGTLSVAANDRLGDAAVNAGLTLNGGTLKTTVTMTLAGTSARPVAIAAGGGTLEVDGTTTLTVPGVITGSGTLTKTGLGVLTLTANNSTTLSSPIVIEDGTITLGGGEVNDQLAIGTGPITFRGGTLTMNGHVGNSTPQYGNLGNAIDVPTGETGTLQMTQRGSINSTLTGGGTFNLVVNYVRGDVTPNWNAFTGQINVTSAGNDGDNFRLATALNIPNAKLNLGVSVELSQIFNPPVDGETVHNIGELSGVAGSIIQGNPVAGRFSNWTVGFLNTDSTFAGTIAPILGQSRLTKVGTGTLTLSGANTHFGRTLVSVGTLALANVNALQNSTLDTGLAGAQQVTFTVAGTNTYNLGGLQGSDDLNMGANLLSVGTNNENTTFAGALLGTGSLTKVGNGILALSGANTYTGGTAVSVGVLTYLNTNAKPATGTTTVAAAATLGLGVGGAGFFSSADVDSLITNTLPGVNMNPASAVGIDTSAGDFTYATSQAGTRPLTKLGLNTLTLAGANTYTGLTTVSQGTLIAPTDTAFGSSSAATAGLFLNPAVGTATARFITATPVIASLASTGAGASSVILGDGALATPTTLTVGGNGVSTTYAGAISDNIVTNPAAIGSLTKVGNGTLTLSGTNTYSGPTRVSAGTLRFATRASLYNAAPAAWTATNIVVDSGATLALNVGAAAPQFTSADLDALLALGTATGGFKSGSFAGIDTTTANFVYASVIADPNGGANALGITKLGINDLSLTGENTYTGGTRINAGVLAVDSPGALGSTGAISFGGGTLRYSAVNTTDYSNRFSTAAGQAYRIDTNAQPVTLASNLTSVSGSLTKLGNGILTLAGTNTYTGATNVSAGVLLAGSTSAFGSGSAVTLDNVAGVAIDLNENSVSVGSLAGGGLLGGNISIGTATLTTGTNDTSTSYGGVISGAGGLTKVGTGTQTLTGLNIYTGATTVTGGTLAIGESLTTSSALIIGDGATVVLLQDLTPAPAAAFGGAPSFGAVPEPTSAALLLFGATAMLGVRRRQAVR